MIRAGALPVAVTDEAEETEAVEHWHWLDDAVLSDQGIEVPAICGAWDGPADWDGDPEGFSPGEVIVRSKAQDCPACLKVMEGHVLDRLAD